MNPGFFFTLSLNGKELEVTKASSEDNIADIHEEFTGNCAQKISSKNEHDAIIKSEEFLMG